MTTAALGGGAEDLHGPLDGLLTQRVQDRLQYHNAPQRTVFGFLCRAHQDSQNPPQGHMIVLE